MLRKKKTVPLPALGAKADPKIEFFMAASHQLKSPVAIIQWCLQSILEMPVLPPEVKKLTEKSLAQADGMSHLLSDMLNVFRAIHGGGFQHDLVPVDMNIILESVFAEYQPRAEQRQIYLLKGPIEKLPPVHADATLLKQALINIVDNAIKYSTDRGRVEIGARVHNNQAEVTVSDHGIGIPEIDQDRLFTEFFRAQNAKDKTDEGTGLGLVLVKHIMESFGGSVSVQSAVGKGSRVMLIIPLA